MKPCDWLVAPCHYLTTTTPTQSLAHVYCCQTAGWIKMPLGAKVNFGPGDVVLDGVAVPPQRGTAPSFLFNVSCGQTAGWMKTPLDTEVDLGRGHVVLDGDPYCCHDRPYRLLLSSCKVWVVYDNSCCFVNIAPYALQIFTVQYFSHSFTPHAQKRLFMSCRWKLCVMVGKKLKHLKFSQIMPRPTWNVARRACHTITVTRKILHSWSGLNMWVAVKMCDLSKMYHTVNT